MTTRVANAGDSHATDICRVWAGRCLLIVSIGAVSVCGIGIPRHHCVAEDGILEIEEDELSELDRDHWAYRSVRPSVPPEVKHESWAETPIDRFVLARMEEQGLRPPPQADRATLVRRLSWDLTGLPPTSELVRRFCDDPDPNAYQRLVDSLLASPRYGEHWAQSWLDLARFAETNGFEQDRIRDSAWKYRDWVIAAANRDLPFDEFIRMQIAGDQFEPESEQASLATAFCLSGPDMTDINSMDERRHMLLNEITSTLGSVVLALQFGCAQCHDHKYDAISQADFYRLRSFFDGSIRLKKSRSVNLLATFADSPKTHLMIRGDWRRPGPPVSPAFPRVLTAKTQAADETLPPRAQLANWLVDAANPLTGRVIANRVWQQHFGVGLSITPSDFGVMGESPSHPELLDYLADQLVRSGWSLKTLHREIVLSGVYRSVGSRPADEQSARAWDDALASDPENRWLSRFPRRRLSAEAIRDGLFAVSGTLNPKMGGPGVSPPLPPELVQTLKSGQWKVTIEVQEHYRRSIYLFARRNLRFPFFATFDRPTADQPCARREASTTAVQSLTLLNSDLMMDAARRLAEDVSTRDAKVEQQIESLSLRLYSRPVTPSEKRQAMEFLSGSVSLVDLCRAMMNSNEFLYID